MTLDHSNSSRLKSGILQRLPPDDSKIPIIKLFIDEYNDCSGPWTLFYNLPNPPEMEMEILLEWREKHIAEFSAMDPDDLDACTPQTKISRTDDGRYSMKIETYPDNSDMVIKFDATIEFYELGVWLSLVDHKDLYER